MDLKLLSFNSSGFCDEKGNFASFLSETLKIDILFWQEHFQMKGNLYKLQRVFQNWDSFCISAVRNERNEFRGRPSGGLGIFWKKSLSNFVKIVKHPESNRVQGIELFQKYVFVNVYFPTDPQGNFFDDFELLKCLQDIDWFRENLPDRKVIIVGDLNCDFSRDSRFVNLVREYLTNHNSFTVWSQFHADFTFAQHVNRNNINYFVSSCIDHFILPSNMLNDVVEAQVIHLGDNLSSHEPIFMCLKIDRLVDANCFSVPEIKNCGCKPSWAKASAENIENYRNQLSAFLENVNLSNGLKCNDLECTNLDHHVDIDNFYKEFSDYIDLAVKNCIPVSDYFKRGKNSNIVAGWNDQVRPFRDSAKFWNAIWVSCGRPLNCQVYWVMKRTKNVFHYVVRKIKKNKEKLEQEKMLESMIHGNVTNLVKKLKNMRSTGPEKLPNLIDGRVGKDNIANYFANNYEELYNVNDSTLETLQLIHDLDINNDSLQEVYSVSPDIVYQAILSINNNKSDINFDFKSNAFRNAIDVVYKHLTVLFQSFLIHGYVPKDLISCSLKPIIKDKMGDKFSSENYRAIGSSSLFLKILDWVIFILHESKLKPSELQFGFQKKNSTTMCSWIVVETVNYFNNRDTTVFSCFLDLSKAFDLVDFSKLFCKLKDRLGKVFIRILAFIYVFQTCCVDWGGLKSKPFKVSNGIRQGAVLSPILFSLYIDELFNLLSCSGFGCYINNVFYGIAGYADDLVLLSPDIVGLQKMFDISKSFLEDLGLKISINRLEPDRSKTKCVAFGSKRNPFINIKFNDFDIPWANSYKHLGHILYKDGSLSHDVEFKRKAFIGSFFQLKQELKSQHPSVFMNLIMIYLSHFYGSNLWNLFDLDSIFIAWNKVVRIVNNLPYRTHRYLLEPFSGFTHVFTFLTNRFLKFYETLSNSEKISIKNLLHFQEKDCRSNFGLNVRNICLKNNAVNILDCKRFAVKYFPIDENDKWRVRVLNDLILCKDSLIRGGFSENEIKDFIYHVACT